MKLRVNTYQLTSPKIARPLRLIALSDVHSNAAILPTLTAVIRSRHPDYICLAGDILDHADDDPKPIVDWLRQLARIAPTIITPGNHELYAKTGWFTPRRPCDATAYYKAVTKIKNCTLLRGPFATYSDQNLTVSALNPPGAWFETERESSAAFQAALRRLPKTSTNRFHILLSHSPNGWLEKNRLLTDHSADSKNPVPHFDLILSGHNHGGFVPPILRPLMHHYGFVGPYFKLVQAHAHGHWSTDQTSLILSSGVTKFAPLPGLKTLGKLTNRLLIPEIEEIILLPGERHALRAGAPESHRQG